MALATATATDARWRASVLHAARAGRWRPWVLAPADADAATPLPWLVALDGDAVMAVVRALPAAPVRVLALGHDDVHGDLRAARALDYTPPLPGRADLRDPRVPAWQAGGAAQLLDYLHDRLLPAAAAVCAAAPRTLLYGHSYGGLFALYAALARPRGIATFLAASPAVWWFAAQQAEPALDALIAARPPVPARLVLAVGGDEAWHPLPTGSDGTPGSRTGGVPTLPAARALADRLRAAPGLTTDFHAVAGATHHTMLAESARLAVALAAAGEGGRTTHLPSETDRS